MRIVLKVTEDKFTFYGLQLAGYTEKEIGRMKEKGKRENFVVHFGSRPHVLTKMWDDLKQTQNEDAKIDEAWDDPVKFLMAHYFLKNYPRDRQMPAIFHFSRKVIRAWIWYYIGKMSALKTDKIIWPEEWKDRVKQFLISVDGVHFWTREAPHPELPYDKTWFSHKNKMAGVSYEIGVSLEESRIVWFSGPWPAGTSDITIFNKPGGLKSKLKNGNMGVADNGYPSRKLAKPSSKDLDDVRKFKAIARARHETVNKRLKVFQSLVQRFRHSPADKHELIFSSVCVIVQYQMELGQPLFDV